MVKNCPFAIELLRMTHGDKLLRVKGILNVAGEPMPFVVHGVQHVFYPTDDAGCVAK